MNAPSSDTRLIPAVAMAILWGVGGAIGTRLGPGWNPPSPAFCGGLVTVAASAVASVAAVAAPLRWPARSGAFAAALTLAWAGSGASGLPGGTPLLSAGLATVAVWVLSSLTSRRWMLGIPTGKLRISIGRLVGITVTLAFVFRVLIDVAAEPAAVPPAIAWSAVWVLLAALALGRKPWSLIVAVAGAGCVQGLLVNADLPTAGVSPEVASWAWATILTAPIILLTLRAAGVRWTGPTVWRGNPEAITKLRLQ